MNNEVQGLIMLGLLESVLGALKLALLDTKHLARSSLSSGQYLNFHANLQELAAEPA